MFVWLNPRLFKRIISCHYINSEIRKWFRSFVTQTGTGARLCGIGAVRAAAIRELLWEVWLPAIGKDQWPQ